MSLSSMMTREPPRSHRRGIPPLVAVVLVAAVLGAGCGYRERPLSAADRRLCETVAAQAGSRGSGAYRDVYDQCVHTLRHPERGGG
jgi:hypothetical protein